MPHPSQPPGFSQPRRRALCAGAATVAALGLPGTARATHVVKPWPAAKPVPALDLAALDGKRWRLDGAGGQVVVLNFWATWCEPCRAEMPSLEALAARRRRDGLTVVAINYRESPEVIQQFLARMSFKVPILLDADGDATVAWTPRVFPSTVLIGRDGLPVHTVLGDLDWGGEEARTLLDPMLAVGRRRPPPVERYP